ncbi:MAG: helix-turn-helix transcriptional regulator [Treponema sp.]|jgi:transcriptional regulator with XRE-family HTH domain|nr:helix-turn-helix transcriptional regulator [Treponema sp.]
MDLNGLFVLNMKKWRKNRGLSQKVVAQRCEAAHTYIRQIESGSRTPSFAFIGKLARALDIEVYRLFYDETEARAGGSSPVDRMDALKTEFLIKMARELDVVIAGLRPN